jgi:hypothetical protein
MGDWILRHVTGSLYPLASRPAQQAVDCKLFSSVSLLLAVSENCHITDFLVGGR